MASTPWRASIAAPSTLRVCRCALMAALALALAALESLIPVPMPVPGMKLGIANVVTAAAAFWLGPVDVAVVLGVRIVLAAFLTGQLATLPFSIVGGACAGGDVGVRPLLVAESRAPRRHGGGGRAQHRADRRGRRGHRHARDRVLPPRSAGGGHRGGVRHRHRRASGARPDSARACDGRPRKARSCLTASAPCALPAAGSAPHGVAAPRLRSPRPSRCAARRARRAGCLHRQLQANRLSRCRRGTRYAGYCSSTVTRRTSPSREAAAVAPMEAASWETMAKPKPAPALDRAPPPW